MVVDLAIYTVVHQPRRLKLPAQPIPRGASIEDIAHCLFDERMNERYFRKVAEYSYYPAARMFLELVRKGMKLAIGFSFSFLRQAMMWDPELLNLFRELVAEENVEIIGVEPYHSFQFLLDLPGFVSRMRWMADEIERLFAKRPVITDTTEMCMSATLYDALDSAGFSGAVMDGRPWVLEWRESTHLYRYGDETPYARPIETARRNADAGVQFIAPAPAAPRRRGKSQPNNVDSERKSSPYLLTRHVELSDDVGFRFSNRGWSGYPLYADTYAKWIADTRGDFVFLGWDFETFGEHHRADSGIFDFMRALPRELLKRGISFSTLGELIDRYSNAEKAYYLPLPVFPSTWAGSGGMDFFLGNSAQRTLFQLMGNVYGAAQLTENPDLLDVASWLAQSDNLHMIQWLERGGSEGEVSAYFTPQEWWSLGNNGIISEQQKVYLNAVHAMEPYLPARLIRSARQKNGRVPRRKSVPTVPDVGKLARNVT
ncbi:MAG TPA: glycoside hydrolase family 57 protein [Ktedonobacteraceae bacterium]